MKLTLTILLILCLAGSVFLTACSMFVKETQATASDGTPLFIDNNTGKATDAATDASGKPNEPLMHSEDTGTIATVTKAGASLPGPIGPIIGVVGSLVGAGMAEYLRRKNAATNAAIAEYESKIRAQPEVAAAVDAKVWDNLSPATMTKLLPIAAAKA
jgi:hypothetical protein